MNGRLAMTIAFLAAATIPALAQGRPDSRSMSCDQVRSLIDTRGAVVLTTGRHTYDRFVAHAGYCAHLEERVPISIRANDTRTCWVYHCKTRTDDGFWDN